MKSRLFTILPIFIFTMLFSAIPMLSCDIYFKIVQNEKELYSAGDEFIAEIQVLLTHKNCPEGIRSTKYETEGLEIIYATQWQEKGVGEYRRKLKLRVADDMDGNFYIKAERKCDKEGGKGNLTIKAEKKK